MKTVGFSTTFIWFMIVSFIMSFFISIDLSHCPTEKQQPTWTAICAGETISSTTTWSVNHPPQLAEAKFLLFILIAFAQQPNLKRRFIRKAPQPGITRHTPTQIRSGPIRPGIFIPYLFATHGW